MADFYIDHDISPKLASALHALGHSAVTTRDLGLGSASDGEQLLTAFQQRRILVTSNLEDFVLLHIAWQIWTRAWGLLASHPGILVVPQQQSFGIVWTPQKTAEELETCLQLGRAVSGELLQRGPTGWRRRAGRLWEPWPYSAERLS